MARATGGAGGRAEPEAADGHGGRGGGGCDATPFLPAGRPLPTGLRKAALPRAGDRDAAFDGPPADPRIAADVPGGKEGEEGGGER
ncbi:hypothetical protein [Streptomyces wuyuanensis]|uniref:hypothetical protein n=1 Tax=Streptomyces wuyuanensis TaxID=1196353 RepID=UPI0037B41420